MKVVLYALQIMTILICFSAVTFASETHQPTILNPENFNTEKLSIATILTLYFPRRTSPHILLQDPTWNQRIDEILKSKLQEGHEQTKARELAVKRLLDYLPSEYRTIPLRMQANISQEQNLPQPQAALSPPVSSQAPGTPVSNPASNNAQNSDTRTTNWFLRHPKTYIVLSIATIGFFAYLIYLNRKLRECRETKES